jgi:methionine-rich copper-binding protein CopC
MRKTIPFFALFALAALPGGIAVAQDSAGPRYVGSEPPSGQFVHEAPDYVSITFSEPLGTGSTMAVTDECGRKVDAGNIAIEENQMSVGLTAGPSGTYTVTYSATGTEEGSQATPGSFTFRAHFGPDCDGSDGGNGGHGGDHDGDGGGGGQDDHQGHPGMGSDDHNTHTVAGPAHTAMHSNADHAESEHMTPRHPHKQTERGRHEHRGRDTEPPSLQDGTVGPRNGGDAAGTSASAPDNAGSEATGTDLVIALSLAAALGAGGGILLRISPLG